MSCNLYSFSDSTKKTGMFYSSGTERFYTPETVNTPLTTATSVADIEGCKIRCKNTAGCQLFSYDQASQTCTMMGKTAGTKDTWTGVNNSFENFFCSSEDAICPSPLPTPIKFANRDDFRNRIIILNDKEIDIEGVKTTYYVKNSKVSGSYIIYTPYSTFIYENQNDIKFLTALVSNTELKKYIELQYFFYKKTMIAPVTGSKKSINYKTKDCSTGETINQRIDTDILYHCLMFTSKTQVRYYVLKKSTVSIIQSSSDEDIFDSFDQLISPYEDLKPENLEVRNWTVNPDTEVLVISGPKVVPGTLLEEFDYIDLKRKHKQYELKYGDNLYRYNIVPIYDMFNIVKEQNLYRITFSSNNIPTSDLTFMKITNKKTDNCVLVRLIRDNLYTECDYRGQPKSRTIPGGLTFDDDNLLVFSDGILDENTYLRFSFMRMRTITNSLPTYYNVNITGTGDFGEYIPYNSQLLSGIDGYNRCSTIIYYSNFGGREVQCNDVYDAAHKCDLMDDTVGFVYDFDTNSAKMINFNDQFTLNTEKQLIVDSHNDGADAFYFYSKWDYFAYQVEDEPDRPSGTDIYEELNGVRLYHNIFPMEKVSPISDGISNSFLGSLTDPQFSYDNNNIRFADNLQNIYKFTNDANYDVLEADPARITRYPELTSELEAALRKIDANYDVLKADSAWITRNLEITSEIEARKNCVFISSNQPNIGGRLFRGVHFKNKLPNRFVGVGGYLTIPVSISTTNGLRLESGSFYRQFLIYRVTGLANEKLNLFCIRTPNDTFITHEYTEVGNMQVDCYWYISVFNINRRKIYFTSYIDNFIILEFDLTSDFNFPGAATPVPLTVELFTGWPANNIRPPVTNKCKLTLGDSAPQDFTFEIRGNNLLIIQEGNTCSDDTIVKMFEFQVTGNLTDLETGENFSITGLNTGAGSFIRYEHKRYSQSFLPLYTEPPTVTLIDALRDLFVPPVALGNKDPLDNFLYFIGFVPIPGAGAAAAAGRAVSQTVRTMAKSAPRIANVADDAARAATLAARTSRPLTGGLDDAARAARVSSGTTPPRIPTGIGLVQQGPHAIIPPLQPSRAQLVELPPLLHVKYSSTRAGRIPDTPIGYDDIPPPGGLDPRKPAPSGPQSKGSPASQEKIQLNDAETLQSRWGESPIANGNVQEKARAFETKGYFDRPESKEVVSLYVKHS